VKNRNLVAIDIDGSDLLASVSPLAPQLTAFTLSGVVGIKDYPTEMIGRMANLTTLRLILSSPMQNTTFPSFGLTNRKLVTLQLLSNRLNLKNHSEALDTITLLPDLKELDISDNQLERFPCLSHMPKLADIYAYGSNLQGDAFEGCLVNMTKLQSLFIYNNPLLTKLSPSLSNSTSLSTLYIWNTGINSVDAVPDLSSTKVRSLKLENNRIEGPLPEWICKLESHATTISIALNNITSLPECFNKTTYPDLSSLVIQNSKLTSWPSQLNSFFQGLATLEVSDLTMVQFDDSVSAIPDWDQMRQSTTLKSVKLRRLGLIGSFPSSLKSTPLLSYLDLSYNKLAGPLPNDMLTINNRMTDFIIEGNQISGSFPTAISSTLTQFKARFNLIEFIPDQTEPTAWSNLITLDLSNNNLSRVPSPEHWATLSTGKLQNFLLANNPDLQGSFPSFLTSSVYFPAIQTVNVSNCQFHGSSPVINSSTLATLDISNNSFNGTISDVILSTTALKTLVMSYNELKGPFPTSIVFNATALTTLDLGYNQLIGEIPVNISQLRNLKTFKVNDNEGLEGSLPSMYVSGGALELQNTQLTLCSSVGSNAIVQGSNLACRLSNTGTPGVCDCFNKWRYTCRTTDVTCLPPGEIPIGLVPSAPVDDTPVPTGSGLSLIDHANSNAVSRLKFLVLSTLAVALIMY
jgi:Leucine-rich repeat (LRR) protein